MAGYSLDGHVGSPDKEDRLYARAVYLRDARGKHVALCFVDLWCGSGYLLKASARKLAKLGAGLGEDGLVVAGTHTHTGPGRYMGNGFYDVFAQRRSGFDKRAADRLVDGVVSAVRKAMSAARPALVAVSVEKLWGVSRNRSLDPFLQNFGALGLNAWLADGSPGAGARADLDPREKAVDPRITVVSAFDARERARLIASFATFSCHATALGIRARTFRRDWPAHAIAEIERRLRPAHPDAVFALGNSAAGDVTPLPAQAKVPAPGPSPEQGEALAARVGAAVGGAWAGAAERSEGAASVTIDASYAPWAPLAGGAHSGDGRIVGFTLGCPLLGGAEDYRTKNYGYGALKAHEGMVSSHFSPGDPRHPMQRALGFLQPWIRAFCRRIAPAKRHPLHCVRIGDHVLATVPGEPTTYAAATLERRLLEALRAHARPAAGVTILGYAGDYAGYFTTEAEYRVQHYEGAHTIYGRNSLTNLGASLEALALGAGPRRSAGLLEIRTLTHAEAERRWSEALREASKHQAMQVERFASEPAVVTFAATRREIRGAAEAAASVELVAQGPQGEAKVAEAAYEAIDATLIGGPSRGTPRLWVVLMRVPEALRGDSAYKVRLKLGGRLLEAPLPEPGRSEVVR